MAMSGRRTPSASAARSASSRFRPKRSAAVLDASVSANTDGLRGPSG